MAQLPLVTPPSLSNAAVCCQKHAVHRARRNRTPPHAARVSRRTHQESDVTEVLPELHDSTSAEGTVLRRPTLSTDYYQLYAGRRGIVFFL